MDLIFFETSMRLALLLGEHVDLLRQKTSQGELVRSSEFYNISLALKSAYDVSKASLEDGDNGKAKSGGGKASKSSSSKSRSVTEVKEKAAKDLMKKLMKEKTEKRKPRVIELEASDAD